MTTTNRHWLIRWKGATRQQQMTDVILGELVYVVSLQLTCFVTGTKYQMSHCHRRCGNRMTNDEFDSSFIIFIQLMTHKSLPHLMSPPSHYELSPPRVLHDSGMVSVMVMVVLDVVALGGFLVVV